MANDLLVSVMIGAALQSSFTAAFAGARGTLTSLGATSDLLKRKHVEMGQAMERSLRHLSGASLAAIQRDYERLGRTIDDLRIKQERLAARMARGVELKKGRQESVSNMRESAATGLAVGLPILASVKQASKYEAALRDIAITGNIRGAEEVALGAAIRTAALSTNQGHHAILQGVGTLVAAGMDTTRAGEYAGLLGKAATATNAEMNDLAKMVFSFTEPLGIKSQVGVKEAINRAAFGGKLGRFELKDMAGSLPELAQAFASRGIKGQQALTEIISSLEVGREGAGTGAEAVTNMRNWLAHMNNGQTADNFKKAGVMYQQSLQNLMASGYSSYDASLMTASAFIDSKGAAFSKEWAKAGKSGDGEAQRKLMESFGLSEVFHDIQTINHLLAMRQNWDKYQSNKKQMGSAQAMGTIDEDYARRVQTMEKAWERFTAQVTDVAITVGSTLLPAISDTLDALLPTVRAFGDWAKQNPGVLRGIVGIVAGVAVLRTGLFALKFLGNFMFLAPGNAVGTAWAVLASRVAIARSMFVAGAGRMSLVLQLFGMGAQRAGQFAARLAALGSWAARTGALLLGHFRTMAAGAMLLARTLGGALLGGLRIAGQAVLWLGRALLMNPIGIAITAIGVGAYLVWRHWGTIKAALQAAGAWLKSLGTTFYQAGAHLVDGLVNGITAKIGAVRDKIVGLGASIKGWFAETLGIRSPSRVFAGFGDNIAQGAAVGIQRTGPVAARAAAAMASAALAASMATAGPAPRYAASMAKAEPVPRHANNSQQNLAQRMTGMSMQPDAGVSPLQRRVSERVQESTSHTQGTKASPAGGGAMVVNYSPQITVQGADGGTMKAQIDKANQLSFREFEQMMQRYHRGRDRTTN